MTGKILNIIPTVLLSAVLSSLPASGMEYVQIEPFLQGQANIINPLSPIHNTNNIIKTNCQAPELRSHRENAFVVTASISLDAMPARQDFTDNIPGIRDDRKRVHKANILPYSAFGVVEAKFNDFPENKRKIWGTGVLISPYLVLTAAHNVYRGNTNIIPQMADEISFFPGLNGSEQSVGEIGVQWPPFIPQEYIRTYNRQGLPSNEIDDYALLALDQPIGNVMGYLGLKIAPSNVIAQLTINVTGYPWDKKRDFQEYQMWGMSGNVEAINNGFMTYKIYTVEGNSGGGIWDQEGNDYYITGVHAFNDPVNKVNKATLITHSRYEQLLQWAEQSELAGYDVEINLLEYELWQRVADLVTYSTYWWCPKRKRCGRLASSINQVIETKNRYYEYHNIPLRVEPVPALSIILELAPELGLCHRIVCDIIKYSDWGIGIRASMG